MRVVHRTCPCTHRIRNPVYGPRRTAGVRARRRIQRLVPDVVSPVTLDATARRPPPTFCVTASARSPATSRSKPAPVGENSLTS